MKCEYYMTKNRSFIFHFLLFLFTDCKSDLVEDCNMKQKNKPLTEPIAENAAENQSKNKGTIRRIVPQ